MEFAIRCTGLGRTFGDKAAVDDVTLGVPQGSLVGMVGPNGAGKTTTLAMWAGWLRPTSGTVWVCGDDVWSGSNEVKEHIGAHIEGYPTFELLTGHELLTYIGRLRRMSPDVVATRRDTLLDALDLREGAHRLVREYSSGMRKKILLAGTLLHRPQVLLLDEPFEAVDPLSVEVMQQVLRDVAAGGGTVVVSSHDIARVDQLCDLVIAMRAGRVVAAGTREQVCGGRDLQQTFMDLMGGARPAAHVPWLQQS